MVYQTDSLQELVDYMASCDKLGLTYVIQKENVVKHSFFSKSVQNVYTLALTESQVQSTDVVNSVSDENANEEE